MAETQYVKKFKVKDINGDTQEVSIVAEKASYDGNGNKIDESYLPLSGGTLSGSDYQTLKIKCDSNTVSFGSSVSGQATLESSDGAQFLLNKDNLIYKTSTEYNVITERDIPEDGDLYGFKYDTETGKYTTAAVQEADQYVKYVDDGSAPKAQILRMVTDASEIESLENTVWLVLSAVN